MTYELKIDTYEDLIKIQDEYFKLKHGIDKFVKDKGLEKIIDILKKGDEKCWDVALSILGNCLTYNNARIKILQINEIKTCCDMVKKVTKESLQNRASRVIGNLAQCTTCCSLIHDDVDVPKVIVLLLNNTTNLESIVTHIRTIRSLSYSEIDRFKMLELGCLRPILKLLKHENSKILDEALKTTSFFINKFSSNCVLQLVEEDAINEIVGIINKYPRTPRSTHCISLLYKISNLELLNPYLGNAGAIDIIIEDILNLCNIPKNEFIDNFDIFKTADYDNCKNKHQLIKSLDSLSLCSQHVHNRSSLVKAGGINMLIESLPCEKFKMLHDRIVSALTFYLYVESNIELLIKKNIVDKLIGHLIRVTELPSLPDSYINIKEESVMFDYMLQYFRLNDLDRLKKVCDAAQVDYLVNNDESCDDEVNKMMTNTVVVKNVTKYSIHSPTFKSISNESISNFDENNINLNVGNIWDAAPLVKDLSPYTSPPYSGSNFSSPWHASSASSVSTAYSPLSCASYDDFTLMDTTSEIDKNDNFVAEDFDVSFDPSDYVDNVDDTFTSNSILKMNSNKFFKNCVHPDVSNINDVNIKDNEDLNLSLFHKQFTEEKIFIKKYETLDIQNSEELITIEPIKSLKRKKELDEEASAKIRKNVEDDLKSERNFNLEENLINENKTLIELKEASRLNKKRVALNNVILILSRLSCTSKPVQFCKYEIFTSMLYCSLNHENSFDKLTRIMKRIIGNTECLDELISNHIISFLHNIYCEYISNNNNSRKIEKFTKLFDSLLIRFSIAAVSKFGQHLIWKNLKIVSKRNFYSIATCYIMRSQKLMNKLQLNSIENIFTNMFNDSSFNLFYSILALSKLIQKSQLCGHFSSSKIINDQSGVPESNKEIFCNKKSQFFFTDKLYQNMEDNYKRITIVGDDKKDIFCDANFISSISEPLASMVGQNFIEGRSSYIWISGADYNSLDLFLSGNSSIDLHLINISTLIRSYEIAHRFLAITREELFLEYICHKIENLLITDNPLYMEVEFINNNLAGHLICSILKSALKINNKIISIFEVYKHCDNQEIFNTIKNILNNCGVSG